MRIIRGEWSNRGLTSPKGRVRPTAEELRDAVMVLLKAEMQGARVLDLFAGSGALGLEALSRGGRSCDFVENDPAALHALKANVARFRLKHRARVFKRDAIPLVDRMVAGQYDIAFADPPYGSRKLDRVVERWADVPFAAVLAVEHALDRAVPPGETTRQVGDSAFTVYRA